jgi:hypothetical protein
MFDYFLHFCIMWILCFRLHLHKTSSYDSYDCNYKTLAMFTFFSINCKDLNYFLGTNIIIYVWHNIYLITDVDYVMYNFIQELYSIRPVNIICITKNEA